jgi:hypothetical protein
MSGPSGRINQQICNRCEEEISRPIPQEEIVRVFIENETQNDEVNMEEEVPPEKLYEETTEIEEEVPPKK